MNIQTIPARDVREKLKQGACLCDIRQFDEYLREHIADAVSGPLPQLQSVGLPKQAEGVECLIFHCKSGMRTRQAEQLLAQLADGKEVYILEGGLDGWKTAGLPTELNRAQPLEMMRQVQIAAGSLALAGAVLGWLVSPVFYVLCVLVGCGLLLAGLTGFCGMARLLARMPWNRRIS